MRLTKERACEMLQLLAAEFGIRTPYLVWTRRVRNGRTSLLHHSIALGPRLWAKGECVLLHEFTHLLGPHGDHTRLFFHDLVRVVAAWYGDPARYEWQNEYRVCHRWAVAAGYSRRRHFSEKRKAR